eukprot:1006015-Amphidinium_carterae.1
MHKSLDSSVESIVSSKQLVLWDHLLQLIGHPDTTLISEVAAGFKLVGVPARSGMFDELEECPDM